MAHTSRASEVLAHRRWEMGLALMKSNSEKEDKYMPTAVLSKRELKKKKRNGRIGT